MQEHPAPNDEADRPRTGSRAGHQSCRILLEIIFLLLLILIFTGQRQLGDLLSSSLHLSLLISFIVKSRLV